MGNGEQCVSDTLTCRMATWHVVNWDILGQCLSVTMPTSITGFLRAQYS